MNKIKKFDPLLNLFIEQIEKQCTAKSILTVVDRTLGRDLKIDLTRNGDKIQYGYVDGVKELLIARLLIDSCAVIHRVFTKKIDQETGFPIKELYGYSTTSNKGAFNFSRILDYELERNCNTDSRTGLPIPPEKSVVYR